MANNQIDYSKEYFTLHMLEDGNMTLYIPSSYTTAPSYSVNGGNWTTFTSNKTLSLKSDDKVRIKCVTGAYTRYSIDYMATVPIFTITSKFEVYGNAMSLLYSDSFEGQTILTHQRALYALFYSENKLESAGNLILPATTLSSTCYSDMFSGCNGLTTAPELPATTLTSGCYNGIFNGCKKLNKITMLATDISASNCLAYWVNGVASTGTFVKHPDMTTLKSGNSGIPTGWTVKNYNENENMSNKKFLDNTGLNTVWNLIKDNFVNKQDFDSFGNYIDTNNTLYQKKYKKIRYQILDNNGKDAYVLISDLTGWENPEYGKTTNNYIIGTISCKRGANMHHTGIYNIVGVASSYHIVQNSPHSNYSLYVDNAISTSENLDRHLMVTPYIIEYKGIKYLALKKTGSGVEIFFDGLVSNDVNNWQQITEQTDLEEVTEIYKPNYTNAYALTTATYFDGTNNHNLIHSGNLLQDVTYNKLVTLKNNNKLIPGQQYRIIDFVTTTNGDGGTNSAGNAFNIIVKAKTSNELSENAKAIKPKFTSLYAAFNDYNPNNIGTITTKYYVNNNVAAENWTGVELNKIPSGILNLYDLSFVPSTDTDIRSIKLASGGSYDLNLAAGKYWVLINYTSGNNKLNTVGAELVSQGSDNVISSDYHIGYTGNNYSNRLYCLEVPKSGIYNIKCYIIAHKNYDNGLVNATVNIQAGSFNNNINSIIPFINNNLSAWEIKYSIENTSNIFNWIKSDGKGYIYYMKDEFGNECNYDFKNIRYGSYYTFDYEINGIHIDGSSVYGNLCYNNVISMDVSGANGKLGFAKIYFKNTTNSSQCHSNKILHDNWQITFGNNCYDNYIGEKSESVNIGNNCHHNIIKCSSKNITLNDSCYSNTIGIGCDTISFGEGCRNNILNDGCLRNSFGSQCIANTLDNDCNDNKFGSQCCDNKIGRLSNNNNFGEGCSSNIFGNNCIHNKFGANCSLNTLGNNCEYNEFLSNCSENIFGEYCSLNKFGSQCNKNIFELRCHSNEFGNNCYSNVFNINCYSNNFGADCFYNKFGIDCKNNLLTSNCHSNTFGNYCWNNKFGNGVFANTFGIDCSDIQIITAENSTTLLQFVRSFKFGNYCKQLKIYPKVPVTTADIATGYLQNFEFGNNLQNINIALEGTADNLLGRKYITNIDKNSNGTIVQKCLMDIDKNINFSYKSGTLTITTISTK